MALLDGDLEAQVVALGRMIGADDPMGWLHRRWKHLDSVSPQLLTVDSDHLRTAGTRGPVWVLADRVAFVDSYGGWGETDTRPVATYEWFMNALVAAGAGSATEWIRGVGHPPLLEMPGPYGPLYQAAGDGRHRTAILKALEIEWEYDVTSQRGLQVGEQFWVAVTAQSPDPQQRRHHEQLVGERGAHLELLIKAGLIEPVGRTYSFVDRSYTVTGPLPFPWALKRPKVVAAASRRYKQSYPRFGAVEAEALSLDASTWSQHLASLAQAPTRTSQPTQTPPSPGGGQPVEGRGPTRALV